MRERKRKKERERARERERERGKMSGRTFCANETGFIDILPK